MTYYPFFYCCIIQPAVLSEKLIAAKRTVFSFFLFCFELYSSQFSVSADAFYRICFPFNILFISLILNYSCFIVSLLFLLIIIFRIFKVFLILLPMIIAQEIYFFIYILKILCYKKKVLYCILEWGMITRRKIKLWKNVSTQKRWFC